MMNRSIPFARWYKTLAAMIDASLRTIETPTTCIDMSPHNDGRDRLVRIRPHDYRVRAGFGVDPQAVPLRAERAPEGWVESIGSFWIPTSDPGLVHA